MFGYTGGNRILLIMVKEREINGIAIFFYSAKNLISVTFSRIVIKRVKTKVVRFC